MKHARNFDASCRPILEVKDLHISFNTDQGWVHAVNGVEFSLYQGKFLGIAGESGCGKSLTALSIMRLLPHPACRISKGEIYFYDQNLCTLPQEQMYQIRGGKISMIFQEPMTALNPVHTVGRQIQEVFSLHFPTMTKVQRITSCKEIIHKVGIADPAQIMKKFPHQLSGGMRQRIMIAIALACQPDILIADEPTTALDVTVQAQILEMIKQLGKDMNMAVILITHDVGLIARYCDRIMVMYAGKIVESANVRSLLTHPRHPYTQGLLACAPSRERQPKTSLPTIHGQIPALNNIPEGCHFAQRCPQVLKICHTSDPQMRVWKNGHQLACHLP